MPPGEGWEEGGVGVACVAGGWSTAGGGRGAAGRGDNIYYNSTLAGGGGAWEVGGGRERGRERERERETAGGCVVSDTTAGRSKFAGKVAPGSPRPAGRRARATSQRLTRGWSVEARRWPVPAGAPQPARRAGGGRGNTGAGRQQAGQGQGSSVRLGMKRATSSLRALGGQAAAAAAAASAERGSGREGNGPAKADRHATLALCIFCTFYGVYQYFGLLGMQDRYARTEGTEGGEGAEGIEST